MAVALALLAAVLFGLGTVAQARAAHRLGRARDGRAWRTLTDRRWLGGTACISVGVLAHTTALRYGSLLLVQPIAYSGLLVALPADALLQRRWPRMGDLLGAGQISVGLAVLVLLMGGPRSTHPAGAVPVLATVAVLVLGGLVLLRDGQRLRRSQRAGRWGLAAGAAMALSSVLVRSTAVAVAAQGATGLLSWSVPGVLAAGATGLVLEQRAYAEGRLAAALGPQDAAGLLLSVTLGAVLLGDTPQFTAATAAGTVLGLALVTSGVLRLSGSCPRNDGSKQPTTGTAGSPPDDRTLTRPTAR